MHPPHPTIDVLDIQEDQHTLVLQATVTMVVTRTAAATNHAAIDQLDQDIDAAGQRVKQAFFAAAVQRLDRDHVLALRHRYPRFTQRGTGNYTFKTSFGTVVCPLVRIATPDGSLQRPSAEVWQLPHGEYVTAGLRARVCELMLNVSVRKTVEQLSLQTGEEALLGRTQVWEIACAEGSRCHAQAVEQAQQTLAADPAAAASLLATVSAEERAQARVETEYETEQQEACAAAVAREPATPDAPALLGFGETLPWQQPDLVGRRRIDPGTVIVEADEVVTHAQKSTGQKRILEYMAVVLTTFVAIHLCAASPEELQRLVGAALLDLGVRQGRQRLLLVCDGARWIRAWFRGLSFTGKALLLCWYHLHKRCTQGLSMACRGRDHRALIERGVLNHLWHGRTREAIGWLQEHRTEMKNTKALDDLVHFLEDRVEYLPDYSQRQAQGLIVASTCVEKMNDFVVAQRCKGRGMSWHEGVHALASLAADRLNQPWHRIQEAVLDMAA